MAIFSYFCGAKNKPMNRGKNICKVLKDIRRKVADDNEIPLEIRECTFEGDCKGTCPYCEDEVRYLEQELQKRRALGKAVTVAGIALSSVMLSGCHPKQGEPTPTDEPPTEAVASVDSLPETPQDTFIPPPMPVDNTDWPEVIVGFFEEEPLTTSSEEDSTQTEEIPFPDEIPTTPSDTSQKGLNH